MSIPFTQFLMPDGRQVPVMISRPAEIEQQARAIIERGYTFEIEMLRTGEVSMEIIKRVPPFIDQDDEVIASELCHNGPTAGESLGVPEAVDRMVKAAEAFKL